MGLAIAVTIFAWNVSVVGNTMEASFLSGANFLWVWYWAWAIVISVLVSVFFTRMILVCMLVITSRALLIGGAQQLMASGTPELSFSNFNTEKLIVGTLLLVVGTTISVSAVLVAERQG